ncbi:MAG: hypothetical protein PHO20_04030, partial [Candidatus Peribacteraceae bacterium]|nr:hypothetical protein [Candidatus Peribacteraceae bacterium]
TLLSGEKEFNGSTVECIADSPVFTDGSFMIEAPVRLNAIKGQTIVSKYNSQSEPGASFYLGMYGDGRLEFVVYGAPGTKSRMILETDSAPLTVGQWHKIQARFDIQKQTMSITADGKEVPATIVSGFDPVPSLYDSTSPVRVGASVFGGGLQDFLNARVKDVTFYPGEFDAKQEAAAVDAAVTEQEAVLPLTEAETQAVTGEQQLIATSIDAVLRAERIPLLSGAKTFNGSTVESTPDSSVFTDGSFAIETAVCPDSLREQAIVSKYNTQQANPDQGFLLSILNGGCLQLIVYQEGGGYRIAETDGAVMEAGVSKRIVAGFDIENQQMTFEIDGVVVPSTVVEGSKDITKIRDGTSPVWVGAVTYGSGKANPLSGTVDYAYFYPIAPHAEQTAVADAAVTEEEAVLPLTEAEANALTTVADTTAPATTETGTEKELTAEMVQTILTDLLSAQDAAEAPQTLTDTPDLSGASLQNGVLQISLPGLGGTASMMSWQGDAKGKEVKTITGEEGRQAAIAAGIIVEKQVVDTTLSLADVLDLPEGIQRDQNGAVQHTIVKETEELGKVSICVDDGRKYIYLANRNGVLGGEGAYPFGQADFPIEFLDGPRYVRWVDLERLSGITNAKVYVWDAQGAVRTLWASESGHLEINGTVKMLGIYPEQHASAWVIRAVNTDPIVPPPAFEETWMQASGELVGIDLSDTEQAAQSVDLTVRTNNPANTIQAIAYRGEERIAAQTVAEDGSVHFDAEEGITSVLLVQSDPNATLYVTNLSVSGQEGSVAPASTLLSPMSNADVGKFSAKQWEHGTFNWAQIAENNGVLRNRGGYENHVNGSVFFHTGFAENSQTQYSRYDLYTTSGSAGIAELWYIDGDGLHRVPQEYWQSMGNSLIVAPGAPKYLVFRITGNGTFDMGMNVGDHATDIMPSQAMELRSTVLVVRKVGPAEGFCTVPAGVSSDNEHARAGGTVNMFYQIINDGLGGGPVTVKIHVGQTGTTADPVTRTFTGNISGLSTIGLSSNVTLTEDNDIATMEVTGANGESTTVGQQVRVPRLAGTRTRAELEPIILAKAHALTVAYWQERLSDAHSEEEADNARQKLAALGIGDGGGVGSTTDALTEAEKVLLAMAGELANNATVEVEEKLEFGSQIEAALSDYLESHERPTSENTMILVFYGSGQFPGTESNLPPQERNQDMETLVEQLRKDYPEVWAFESGQNLLSDPEANIPGPGITATEALQNVQAFIDARLRSNPHLTNVVLVGYSWGGGMVYEVSQWMSQAHENIALIGSAYVDAVIQGNIGSGLSQRNLPTNTITMLNIFQSSVADETWLRGASIDASTSDLLWFSEIDLDNPTDTVDHSSIDNAAVPYVLQYLRQIILAKS